jgi:hypothetical protein
MFIFKKYFLVTFRTFITRLICGIVFSAKKLKIKKMFSSKRIVKELKSDNSPFLTEIIDSEKYNMEAIEELTLKYGGLKCIAEMFVGSPPDLTGTERQEVLEFFIKRKFKLTPEAMRNIFQRGITSTILLMLKKNYSFTIDDVLLANEKAAFFSSCRIPKKLRRNEKEMIALISEMLKTGKTCSEFTPLICCFLGKPYVKFMISSGITFRDPESDIKSPAEDSAPKTVLAYAGNMDVFRYLVDVLKMTPREENIPKVCRYGTFPIYQEYVKLFGAKSSDYNLIATNPDKRFIQSLRECTPPESFIFSLAGALDYKSNKINRIVYRNLSVAIERAEFPPNSIDQFGGNKPCFNLMLHRGNDVYIPTSDSFMNAIRNGNLPMVKYLDKIKMPKMPAYIPLAEELKFLEISDWLVDRDYPEIYSEESDDEENDDAEENEEKEDEDEEAETSDDEDDDGEHPDEIDEELCCDLK